MGVMRIVNILQRVKTPADFIRLVKTAMRVIRQSGLHGLFQTIGKIGGSDGTGGWHRYSEWVKLYDTPSIEESQSMDSAREMLKKQPLISVVMPTYNTPVKLLSEAIESVQAQIYPHWELCVADDNSSDNAVRHELEKFAASDSRIKVMFREQNGHIARASNSALEIAAGDWVALLDHDDLLSPNALLEVAIAINQNSNAKLIYSDEDKLELDGTRGDPYFKPDWNYHLFLSHNLVTHLAVFRKDIVEKIGGFREGYDGAQDYDFTLRFIEECEPEDIIHIPHILYHWRRVVGSTALSSEEKPYAMLAGQNAINDHLRRCDINATAGLIGIGYRVDYQLPHPEPLVSIIIPTRDKLNLLKLSVATVRDCNDYSNWELIIVDNNSQEAETISWLNALQEQDGRVIVIRDEEEFNYSRLNNVAAKVASGSYLLLMNNDIEAKSGGWLSEMVSVCAQKNVGAVGARLWYPNDTLQHGGVIIGVGGVAGHANHGIARGLNGYMGRATLRHEVSAVTAACLLTRKEAFTAVGGLDEVHLKIAFNDIDYCLKLRESGWKIVWTPFAELYHHESASRGYEDSPEKIERFEREQSVMRERWASWIAADPAYNPNLSLANGMFEPAFPPRHHKNVGCLDGSAGD